MGLLLRRKRPEDDKAVVNKAACSRPIIKTASRLFQPGGLKPSYQRKVTRAPFLPGLSVPSKLRRPFQRPMLKRRAYNAAADAALSKASLGPKRRFDGMSGILARAGKGLQYQRPKLKSGDTSATDDSSDESESEQEEERPFEPLRLWLSPHAPPPKPEEEGKEGEEPAEPEDEPPRVPMGLPPQLTTKVVADEFGIEENVTVLQAAPAALYGRKDVYVPTALAKWLRPHQRQGVQFLYDCVMGLNSYKQSPTTQAPYCGCILADDMGLGKTLQSVTLIATLLQTGITRDNQPTCRRVIVVCPCSLVKNWENEFVKWLGPNVIKTLALAEADRKTVEKNIDIFVRTKMFNVLIASYECLRTHIGRLIKYKDCCDLLVCDEAHRLKNSENQTSRALNSLPVKRRVLLTGTPMQNDLLEFYAMVDFTNPGILGTPEEFRRKTLGPILRGREPDATDRQREKMMQLQQDMSNTVNEFILRRVNTVNAQHLPPKLVQVVCCNLTEIQQQMYQHLVDSKEMQHVVDGKQVNCLGSIQMLMKLCNHPSLICNQEDDRRGGGLGGNRRAAASKAIRYNDEKDAAAAPGADGIAKYMPEVDFSGRNAAVHPEFSGKMYVLYRLMKEMRRPGNGNDKIVIVSNYTQTLDLIGRMCRENQWGFCRLDGSITMKKRQRMVDEFNDPGSSLVAFLLSSKAGGCGLNLIGGNRLVLFDPDWNPAVDKQAAARCWRDGQKKRCFTYRFLATGTVEEKIFQRQLSKEGLQSVVDDKEQVNALSTKDLRNLFKLRSGTPSDTHDKLRCERCNIIHDDAELKAQKVLPKKLAACGELFAKLKQQEDASHFLEPLDPTTHGVSKEEYEGLVKQPMDLGTIQKKLDTPPEQPAAYKNVSSFSKDVNRIFGNVVKVWSPGEDEIADASRRLQAWWLEQWKELVPRLMCMQPDAPEEEHVPKKENDAVDEALEACAAVNNERTDDYQQQIGMPDEENMRSWSHHHSAESVDDPIFRAAMRGSDAVSFVFGLEVTWSLIQQRQQEEEERIAMEEMEALDNMEDEEESDDEDAGDSKPPADPSKDSSNSDAGDDDMIDSDDESDDGSKEYEPNAAPEEGSPSASSSEPEQDSPQSSSSVKKEEPLVDSTESESSSDESVEPVAKNVPGSPQSSSDESEEPAVAAPASSDKSSVEAEVVESSSEQSDSSPEPTVSSRRKPRKRTIGQIN